MDVFDLRARLVADYQSYTRSFIKIRDEGINSFVDDALPAFKVLGQWRFKRIDIDRWIEAQKTLHTRRSNAGEAT